MIAGKVAKWWLPDDVLMLEELPHTATGKLNKLALRARYQDHLIENAKAQA
jgi:acyl-CoA synthetase (AMP-forming)/AMP-acid ligase II